MQVWSKSMQPKSSAKGMRAPGSSSFVRLSSAVLAIGALLAPHAAMADDDGIGKSNGSRVDIEVSAKVKERCGISSDASRSTDTARIDQATTLTFAFRIDCNAPFAIGASSRHGGMQKIGADAKSANGFAIVKPYDVNLIVETDADTMRSAKCASNQLAAAGPSKGCDFFGTTAGQGMSSRQRTAIGRDGTVTVHWGDGDIENGRRLAAGQYQDVITVVVGVRT